mmetsp:Transcript_44489/g.102683  ORF Transcript_44489/g.102683 Transcript_44489/m.102683 type:complete len:552 (-) Transcript_44489:47-1702(-)
MEDADARPSSSGTQLEELLRLRAQVCDLSDERDKRLKVERLLELQTIQLQLQQDLREKTERLLQREQQTTQQLKAQKAELQETTLSTRVRDSEDQLEQARQHIEELEVELHLTTETASELKSQNSEHVKVIQDLNSKVEQSSIRQLSPVDAQAEIIRLQIVVQSRDRSVDELTTKLRQVEGDAVEAQSEVAVLRHQVKSLQKQLSEKATVIEQQLRTERDLRVNVFEHQAKIEQLSSDHVEERQKNLSLTDQASQAEVRQQKISDLEAQLADEQALADQERTRLTSEAEQKIQAKEKIIRHQTSTITALSRELKEKQAEMERLLRASPELAGKRDDGSHTAKADKPQLPAIASATPRGMPDDIEQQSILRSLDSMEKQLKGKDTKIAKQAERLQSLTEMLEKRDKEVEELEGVRRDKEATRAQVLKLQDAAKSQPRVQSHAEAERRLIDQEVLLRDFEKKVKELEDVLSHERIEKDALARELGSLQGHANATGAQAGVLLGGLRSENTRLRQTVDETQQLLDARTTELRRVRELRPIEVQPVAPASTETSS